MKFRNFSYFLREACANIYANKWMSIASTIIVVTTLYIFGIFFLAATNVEKISDNIEDQPIHAFVVDKADIKMAETAKQKIEGIDGVTSVELIDKDKGIEELKEVFDNYEEMFAGIDSSFLSYKLVIHIKDASKAQEVVKQVQSLSDIKKVNYAQDIMDKVTQITKIARGLAYTIAIVLGLVSLFIIIYTIKLTVFARRREINIMKYVGATDWFIKWPFVIEGIIIGVFGSMFSVYVLFLTYGFVFNIFNGISSTILQLMPLTALIKLQVFWLFLILGSGIGVVGSIISVKKYLYV